MESETTRAALVRERMNRGLSVAAAADAMKLARGTLVRFEAGESVSLASAKAIADFYGCKVTDLVVVQGRPVASPVDCDEAA